MKKVGPHQHFNRTELRRLCKQMVRKDLEIYQKQNTFTSFTGEANIFSKKDDDLCSIRHTIILATGASIKQLEESRFLSCVMDASVDLIFYLHSGFSRPAKGINRITSNLVDIIFNASKESQDSGRVSKFKREIKVCFGSIFGNGHEQGVSQFLSQEMLRS
jgi:hypothetical protein